MTRRGGWSLGVAAVLAAAALSPSAHAAPGNDPAGTRRVGRLTVGERAPALSLERLGGTEEVTLQGLQGRVVVLDFWATWCAPCRAVMPMLDDLYRRHRSQGLSVVGLSPEADSAIRAYMQALPVEYTIARDTGGTMQRYGVRALPTIVVLGRRGEVREVLIGVDGAAVGRLSGLVTRLLAERAP